MWARGVTRSQSHAVLVGREGIEPPQSKTADLQSAELTTCSTYPTACAPRGRVPRGEEVWSAASSLIGADDGTRTRNRRFTKPLLYQLSYVGGDAGWYRTSADPRNRADLRPCAGGDGSERADSGVRLLRGPAAGASAALRAAGPLPDRVRRVDPPTGGSSDVGAAGGSRRRSVAARRGRRAPSGAGVGRRVRRGVGRRLRRRAATSDPPRCAAASNSSTDPATAALSDPTCPRIGIRATARSSRRADVTPMPAPSLPTTSASGPRRSDLAERQRRRLVGADEAQPTPCRSTSPPPRSSSGTSSRCSTAPAEALIGCRADGRRRGASGTARRGRRTPRR